MKGKDETIELIYSELLRRKDKLTSQNVITIFNCMDTIEENERWFATAIEKVFDKRSKTIELNLTQLA